MVLLRIPKTTFLPETEKSEESAPLNTMAGVPVKFNRPAPVFSIVNIMLTHEYPF